MLLVNPSKKGVSMILLTQFQGDRRTIRMYKTKSGYSVVRANPDGTEAISNFEDRHFGNAKFAFQLAITAVLHAMEKE
jgi:hypothetical protein